MKTYKLKPIYKSFIWGGDKLIERYHLDSNLKNIGTIYFVIATGDLDNIVEETGQPLSEFYETHKELFGIDEKIFPVRMTVTCNDSYQSYQIHPTDEYALKHEGTKGKVSGSVALFVKENSPVRIMRFGNKCKSLDEFKELVNKEDWDNLFNVIERPAGAFLHTPAGVIHGGKGNGEIGATWGTNGDITYRFYDFNRHNTNRSLDLEKCYETVNIPEVDLPKPYTPKPICKDGIELYEYYDKPNEYIAKRIKVNGEGEYENPLFMFYACVDGEGEIAGTSIKTGECVLVPCNSGSVDLKGKMDLILLSYRG